jgi:hypothetical protein
MKTKDYAIIAGAGLLGYYLLKGKGTSALVNPVYTTAQLADMTAHTKAIDDAATAMYNSASATQQANAIANVKSFFASQPVGVEFDDSGQWAILNAALEAQNPRTK